MRKVSMAVALVALFVASTLSAYAQNYAVRGTIHEFGSTIGTRPLAGATVMFSPGGRSGISDANGFYSIGSVPAGSYTVRVSAPGHEVVQTAVNVSSDLVLDYRLQVVEAGSHDLRGVVTESGSFGTRPLAGAVVKAMPSGRTSTTDASGRYAFENLATGTYTLTATAPGHRTASRTVTLQSDAEVGINLPDRTTTDDDDDDDDNDTRRGVSGVIVDSDGRAISGASIRLTPGNYQTTTDSEGRFTLPSIRNGTYMLHLRAPGYPAMNRKVTIGSDRTITLTMGGRKSSTVDRDDDDDDDGVRKEKKQKKEKEKKAKKAKKGKKGKGHK